MLRLRESSKGSKSFPSPYNPEYVRGISFEFIRGLAGGGGRMGEGGAWDRIVNWLGARGWKGAI